MHTLVRPCFGTRAPGRPSLARCSPLSIIAARSDLTESLRDSREAGPSPAAMRAGWLFFSLTTASSSYGTSTKPSWRASRSRVAGCARRRDDCFASTGSTRRLRPAPRRLLVGSGTRQGTASGTGCDRRAPGRRWARRSRSRRSPIARRVERRRLAAARGCSRPPAESPRIYGRMYGRMYGMIAGLGGRRGGAEMMCMCTCP